MKYKILVVDDLEVNLISTRLLLEKWGYEVDTAQSGDEALKKITRADEEYAIVLLDYRMPSKDGAAVAREIRAVNDEAIILIFSEDDSREALKDTWAAGAVGYLDKDSDPETILEAIENNCRKFEETSRTLKARHPQGTNEKLIASLGMAGSSDQMAEVALQTLRYRTSDDPVLILGETGTGKELIARALHNGSMDNFRVVDGTIYQGSTQLLESELFGYEKGAFTGANNMGKVGILESARGGTVFFDEIHRLSIEAQGKLLRVLQEKKIRRVGGTDAYPVNFRIIAAGKPDLEDAVEKGSFMPDLYYRLNVLTIKVPPLKERRADIAPLIAHFCKKYTEKTGQKKTFLMKTVRYLENYCWPGNVRELENTVRKLLIDTCGHTVDPKQLDCKFFCASDMAISGIETLAELERRHEAEKRRLLVSTLNATNWIATKAASQLDVPSSTMYDLMKNFGIKKNKTEERTTHIE